MAQPYVGEIRMFAGNFAPAGWYFCDGQLLPISENETLFNLIGTTYGGDGQSTFALPDMRGRIPLHTGDGFTLSETGGVESVTLTVAQTPTHTHALSVDPKAATSADPVGRVPANAPGALSYAKGTSDVSMDPSAIAGGRPHDNLMPYLCVNYIISMFGIFPSQT